IGVWWLFFSRAPWLERLGAIALMVIGVIITGRLVDRSISNALMGLMLPFFSLPVLGLALVVWAAAARGLSTGRRRLALGAAVLLGCSVFTVIRTGGITGDAKMDLHWRWTKTPEQRLLAQMRNEPVALPPAPAPAAETTKTAPAAEAPAASASTSPVAEKPKTEASASAAPSPSAKTAATTAEKRTADDASDDTATIATP